MTTVERDADICPHMPKCDFGSLVVNLTRGQRVQIDRNIEIIGLGGSRIKIRAPRDRRIVRLERIDLGPRPLPASRPERFGK
jgi:hypothetical protein